MTLPADNATILIIDDTPGNLSVAVSLLEDRGYRVAIAQDGEEGVLRAQLLQPDLILLDVMMPGKDGFEVCQQLKGLPSTFEIPVIFMTAQTSTDHKIRGFRAGAVDYVTKPLQIDEVIARVDTHLKLSAAQKRLEEQNVQLKKHHEELEQRVRVRTVLLEVTNEELRQSEQRYREIFDNVSDSLYLLEVTPEKRYRNLEINPAFEKSSGMPRTSLIGKYIEETVPENTAKIVIEKYNRCLEVGAAYEEEVALDMPSGRRSYLSTLIPVSDENGNFHRIVGIYRDITELQHSQYQLKESYAQLQAISRQREKDLEEERKHIARELHDELGQLLGTLRMSISLLPDRFDSVEKALRQQSNDMLKVVDRGIKVMRDVVTSLRPVALDAGIAAALEWLTKEFSAQTAITCHLKVEENANPGETLSIAIFRIVQESLTNITRHASDATLVEVDMKKTGDRYTVKITDNGKGFDTSKPRNKKSFGLSGMEERCHMLGGTIRISSAIGSGTTLDLTLPADISEAQA